jgi:hypothetical protein
MMLAGVISPNLPLAGKKQANKQTKELIIRVVLGAIMVPQ